MEILKFEIKKRNKDKLKNKDNPNQSIHNPSTLDHNDSISHTDIDKDKFKKLFPKLKMGKSFFHSNLHNINNKFSIQTPLNHKTTQQQQSGDDSQKSPRKFTFKNYKQKLPTSINHDQVKSSENKKVNSDLKRPKLFINNKKPQPIKLIITDRKNNINSIKEEIEKNNGMDNKLITNISKNKVSFYQIKQSDDTEKSIREENKQELLPQINQSKNISPREIKELEIERIIQPIIYLNSRPFKPKEAIRTKKIFTKKQRVFLNKVKNMVPNNIKKVKPNKDETILSIRLKLNPVQLRKSVNEYNNLYNTNSYFVGGNMISGIKFTMNNYDRFGKDFLSMRKTINAFSALEQQQRNQREGKNPLIKGKNKKIKIKDEAIEEEEDEENFKNQKYSKYFLPCSGSGLLSKGS